MKITVPPNIRSLLVTVLVAVSIASTVRWALVVPDLPVSPDGNGIGAVSSGIALHLIGLVVFGVFTATLLVLASRRGVVPASTVRAQAVLSVVLVATLFVASGRIEARIFEAGTAEPDWSKSAEAVNAEILLSARDYWDAINAGIALYDRIAAVQLVAFWCALWAWLQPDRRRRVGPK